MGTNFYAVIPIKKRSKEKLKEIIEHLKSELNNDDDTELSIKMYELKDQWHNVIKDTRIHLGKRSAGWSFCWDANKLKYYKPSLKSIHKWIVDNNATIEDECGERFTWEEFINDEIGYCLHTSEPIYSIDKLKHTGNENVINRIKTEYLDKGLPFYEFCSHRTYHKMHPDENSYNYHQEHPDFTKYAKKGFVDEEYSEFHSKDGLRFAIYTDFS